VIEETIPPQNTTLCAEACIAYDDLDALACAQVQPSTAHRIGKAKPMDIHVLVRDYAHALMVYHTALELHRTTSRVLTEMRSKRDTVFSPGRWIQDHLNDLTEEQRQAAEHAMTGWGDGMFQPFSFSYLLFMSDFIFVSRVCGKLPTHCSNPHRPVTL
jgi:hypothetical protein